MFDGKYFDWNQKKVKGILDFYGHQFMAHKKILDLGCGYADISGPMYRLGADVTAADARQEHLKVVSKRYPGIKTVKVDLDKEWSFYRQSFDLILDLSLLCHIENFESHLRSVCSSTKYLVLETAVCDSEDDRKNIIMLEHPNYDLSISGKSSRPTAANIERVLQECGMSYQRFDTNKFNSGTYQYDWKAKNDNSCDVNKRRIWFCIKNVEDRKIVQPAFKNGGLPVLSSGAFATSGSKLQNSNVLINHPVLNTYKPKQNPESPFANLKDLKVALCISGHMRTFENNFPSVQEHILSQLNCDVFIHTWDTLGLSYRPLDNNLQKTNDVELYNKLNKFFNPKKIIIEPRREFEITHLMRNRLEQGRDIHGMLAMFYKIEACNNLKKEYEKNNNIKYDIVIRFRGDIFMGAPLPINKGFNKNYLYIPTYGHFGGLCDQLAFGSSEVMDKYSSLYSNIQNHLETGAVFNPEKILHYHVLNSNIPTSKVYVKFLLKRSNGLVQDNMLLERALGFIR